MDSDPSNGAPNNEIAVGLPLFERISPLLIPAATPLPATAPRTLYQTATRIITRPAMLTSHAAVLT